MIKQIIIFFLIVIFLLILNAGIWVLIGLSLIPSFLINQYIIYALALMDISVFVICIAYLIRSA